MSPPPLRPTILVDWARLARWREWAQSKLPYIGAAALLLVSPTSPALGVLQILCTIVLWAAFGYGLNEVADRSSDAQAGKRNRAARLSRASLAVFLVLTGGGAFGLSLQWAADAAGPALVVFGLGLAVAYSVPPVRLKERGAIGLLAGAAAQWAVPVLAVSAAEPGGWLRPAAWSLALLSLALGTRWMAVHQLQDASGDRRAAVRTYASGRGDVGRMLFGAFACELVFLTATLALAWPRSLPAVLALTFWILQSMLLRSRRGSLRIRLRGYHDAPLAGYYFFLFPVTLALSRGPASSASLAIAAVLFILGSSHLYRLIAVWARSIVELAEGLRLRDQRLTRTGTDPASREK
jgi:4-hydroxybenzoate polyprenyltransferase